MEMLLLVISLFAFSVIIGTAFGLSFALIKLGIQCKNKETRSECTCSKNLDYCESYISYGNGVMRKKNLHKCGKISDERKKIDEAIKANRIPSHHPSDGISYVPSRKNRSSTGSFPTSSAVFGSGGCGDSSSGSSSSSSGSCGSSSSGGSSDSGGM